MSRKTLVHDWQDSLAHCESCAAAAPPRYQWLYQVRARIYRVLLAMYCDKQTLAWDPPALTDESSDVLLDDSVTSESGEFCGRPAKSKAQILKTLKTIANANEGVPVGNVTREDVLLRPQLVADVTKRDRADMLAEVLRDAGIPFQRRRQGIHRQFLVNPRYLDDALMVIEEFHDSHSSDDSLRPYQGLVLIRIQERTLLAVVGTMLVVLAACVVFGSRYGNRSSFEVICPALISVVGGVAILIYAFRRK